MNTDQGSQYTRSGWITTLTEAKIKLSMDGRGRYLDHIFIQRLWRSLKQAAVYLHEITDGFQAKRISDNWIGFYNSERPHTALDKRTPDAAYFVQVKMRKAAWTENCYILDQPQTCPKKHDHFRALNGGIPHPLDSSIYINYWFIEHLLSVSDTILIIYFVRNYEWNYWNSIVSIC